MRRGSLTSVQPSASLFFRASRWLLVVVLLVWGCVTPVARRGVPVASLRILMGPPSAAYSLTYKTNMDWRRATATLTPAGGIPRTAEAMRGDALSFSGLAPGEGYHLAVTLQRGATEGLQIEAGRFEKADLTLAAGVNTLTMEDFTATHPVSIVSTPVALQGPFVSSLPEEGPGAGFNFPSDVLADGAGVLYVVDNFSNRIRRITPDGIVSTVAGSGLFGASDGPALFAAFAYPDRMAMDASGTLYVSQLSSNFIRKIDKNGAVSTISGNGDFLSAAGMTVDADGNLYIADTGNHRIRRLGQDGSVVTLAGGTQGDSDGVGADAQFRNPTGIARDASGTLYVADTLNHRIKKVTPEGLVTTLAGAGVYGFSEGVGTAAAFASPRGVAVDQNGHLFVADTFNNAIRKITPEGGVTTLAGGTGGYADGTGAGARFNRPTSLSVDASGTIYVADRGNHIIRRVTPEGVVTTVLGKSGRGFADGVYKPQAYSYLSAVELDEAGNLYIAERNRIFRRDAAGGVTTLAGDGTVKFQDGPGAAAGFLGLKGMAIAASGTVFVTDDDAIRRVTAGGEVTTFAGSVSNGYLDGPAESARFSDPRGLAVDASGTLYVADRGNHCIRKITPDGLVSTVAGNGTQGSADGVGADARFSSPDDVVVDASGTLYVADTQSGRIRRIATDGTVTTLAGRTYFQGWVDGVGTVAQFGLPGAVALDAVGNVLVSDSNNYCIRRVTPGGVVDTVAGRAKIQGFADGPADQAVFGELGGLTVDASGTIYVVDLGNQIIRRIR